MDKGTIPQRISRGLKWENKLPKLKRSILFWFRTFSSIVLRFLIIPRAYLLFCLGSPIIFGYVTFHIFVSIISYSFYCFVQLFPPQFSCSRCHSVLVVEVAKPPCGGSVAGWFRALALKSGGPWFKSSTLLLSGFVLGSPKLNSATANWSASHQLRLLTVYLPFAMFVYLFTVSPISTTVQNTFDT